MQFNSTKVFNLIFFGAIPVVAVVLIFEFLITSNSSNFDSNVNNITIQPEIISAKRYQLNKENQSISPVSMDFIDDRLYIFEKTEATKFELKRSESGAIEFAVDLTSKPENKFIFERDNSFFAIQSIVFENQLAQETGIEIINLKNNQIVYSINNPVNLDTGETYRSINNPILTNNKEHIALIFESPNNSKDDKIIKIWNLVEGKTVRDIKVNNYKNIHFTPDNNFLALNYDDKKPIYFYNLNSIKDDFNVDLETFVEDFSFIPNSNKLVALSFFDPILDFKIFETVTEKPIEALRFFDYKDNQLIHKKFLFKSEILKIFPLINPGILALISEDGRLQFINLNNYEIIKDYNLGIELKNISTNNIQLSSDKQNFIFLDKSDYIQIISFKERQQNVCNRFSFSLDGLKCLFKIRN
jgi:WD40 repeat protein